MTEMPVFSNFVENLLSTTLHFLLLSELKVIIVFFEPINFILEQYSIQNLFLDLFLLGYQLAIASKIIRLIPLRMAQSLTILQVISRHLCINDLYLLTIYQSS